MFAWQRAYICCEVRAARLIFEARVFVLRDTLHVSLLHVIEKAALRASSAHERL